MRLLTFIAIIAAGALVRAGDPREGKEHEFQGNALLAAPMGAKADWKPSARVKADDSIAVRYAIKWEDVELFECSSDNADVRVSIAMTVDGKGVRVGIRSGDFRTPGKKATAKVAWKVYEVNGRLHFGSLDVVFE